MGKRWVRLTNRVREFRLDMGEMTQQELADLDGGKRQTVNSIESNKYSPSLEIAVLIARTLNAGVKDVFGGQKD